MAFSWTCSTLLTSVLYCLGFGSPKLDAVFWGWFNERWGAEVIKVITSLSLLAVLLWPWAQLASSAVRAPCWILLSLPSTESPSLPWHISSLYSSQVQGLLLYLLDFLRFLLAHSSRSSRSFWIAAQPSSSWQCAQLSGGLSRVRSACISSSACVCALPYSFCHLLVPRFRFHFSPSPMHITCSQIISALCALFSVATLT